VIATCHIKSLFLSSNSSLLEKASTSGFKSSDDIFVKTYDLRFGNVDVRN
jgi:hypothetical protein